MISVIMTQRVGLEKGIMDTKKWDKHEPFAVLERLPF